MVQTILVVVDVPVCHKRREKEDRQLFKSGGNPTKIPLQNSFSEKYLKNNLDFR